MDTNLFKILLADDSPHFIQLLEVRLYHKNYTFYKARDGAEALALALRIFPDLVILDVNMPKLDGFEVCRRLRANEETEGIPIILLSAAKVSPSDQLQGLGLGADDYVIKPVNFPELKARIVRKLQLQVKAKQSKKLVEAILHTGSSEMIVVDDSLTVVKTGPGLAALINIPPQELAEIHLLDLWPELVGYEDDIEDITADKSPQLYLPMVNRRDNRQKLRYLDLKLQKYPDPEKAGWFLLLVTDVTQETVLRQEVQQKKNELILLSQKLIDSNHKLDYVLRRYVPSDVVDAVISGEMSQETGGQLRNVAVLFADMRGYTKAAQTLPPNEVMNFLNGHLHVASEAINKANGTIAQYMGDAIMAIFNAVTDQPDYHWQAIQAGFFIQEAIAKYHYSFGGEEIEPVAFGVGIYSGPALVGNTGAKWQYAFSAIGNTTNMAYRLTMLAGGNETYIGEQTYKEVQDRVKVIDTSPLKIKGVDKRVPVYKIERLD